MKTDKEVIEHFNQSKLGYDVKGESHVEYYRDKHPKFYRRLISLTFL